MECSHKNIVNKTIEKEIFDLKFKHKAKVCKDCNAYLRGPEFEKSYMNWLEEVYKEKRSKFQVQCHFPQNLLKCAENFLENYPGISSTVLMRFLVTIYLDVIDGNEKLSQTFEKIMDQEILNSFTNDKDKKKVNIQFKPGMMVELVAIGELLDVSLSSIVENSVLKMMTAITSHDKKLRSFWEKEIKGYLEIFLKSA